MPERENEIQRELKIVMAQTNVIKLLIQYIQFALHSVFSKQLLNKLTNSVLAGSTIYGEHVTLMCYLKINI